MTAAVIALAAIAAILAGVSLWLLAARARAAADRAALSERLAARDRELAALTDAETRLGQTFQTLASEVLKGNAEQFLALAKGRLETEQEKARADLEQRKQAVEHLVKPIAEALKKTEEKLGALETKREGAYAGLIAQVRAMQEGSASLRDETRRLTQALRKPQVRGRYGEIQLERVVELAGMRAYCDFDAQATIHDGEGGALRPDMLVRLPSGRVVAVDAKTNLEAYLDALEAPTSEQADACLARFADHVLNQAKALGSKRYWDAIDGSPEFVVMFVPGDQFVDAALARRPELLDFAGEKRVIIVSPSTLIGLLWAVHAGWREQRLTEEAQSLFELGKTLHQRAAIAMEYAAKLGEAIETTVKRFNRFVGSVDARLMPTLRRFEDAGAKSAKPVREPKPIAQAPQIPAATADGEANPSANVVTRAPSSDALPAPSDRAQG